jgi:hypothetical protein
VWQLFMQVAAAAEPSTAGLRVQEVRVAVETDKLAIHHCHQQAQQAQSTPAVAVDLLEMLVQGIVVDRVL